MNGKNIRLCKCAKCMWAIQKDTNTDSTDPAINGTNKRHKGDRPRHRWYKHRWESTYCRSTWWRPRWAVVRTLISVSLSPGEPSLTMTLRWREGHRHRLRCYRHRCTHGTDTDTVAIISRTDNTLVRMMKKRWRRNWWNATLQIGLSTSKFDTATKAVRSKLGLGGCCSLNVWRLGVSMNSSKSLHSKMSSREWHSSGQMLEIGAFCQVPERVDIIIFVLYCISNQFALDLYYL